MIAYRMRDHPGRFMKLMKPVVEDVAVCTSQGDKIVYVLKTRATTAGTTVASTSSATASFKLKLPPRLSSTKDVGPDAGKGIGNGGKVVSGLEVIGARARSTTSGGASPVGMG